MSIPTVLGPIAADTIEGQILSHEHLALDLRTAGDTAGYLDEEHASAIANELSDARTRYGLSMVVDQTCRGMGRNIAQLQQISASSGVPVVASTGWYYQKFHPPGEPSHDPVHATEILVRELTEGIDGTTVKAGVIGEIGTHGPEPSPAEHTALLAAGHAASQTNRPVATHAHLGTGALAQLRVLAQTPIDLSRVCIGHQDLTDDPAQHRQIADRGAYLAFDTVGKSSYQSDSTRVRLVLDLLEQGLESHLMLSNDISRYAYLRSHGGQGYGHVLAPFATALRQAGVGERTLHNLYRNNALRWLTGVSPEHQGVNPTPQGAL